jgi:hypothetical protein
LVDTCIKLFYTSEDGGGGDNDDDDGDNSHTKTNISSLTLQHVKKARKNASLIYINVESRNSTPVTTLVWA